MQGGRNSDHDASSSKSHRLGLLLYPAAFVIPCGLYLFELLQVPLYRFAPILIGVIGYYLPRRISELGTLTAGTVGGTWLAWGPAAVCCILAIVLQIPWWGACGALMMILGAEYARGGSKLVRCVFPWWCCLWLTIRLPFELDRAILIAMQRLSVSLAARILDAWGQLYHISGEVLYISGNHWTFSELGGGLTSLGTGWAFTWLLCLLLHRSLVRWAALMALVPVWVIGLNVVRVALTVRQGISLGANEPGNSTAVLLEWGVLLTSILLTVSMDQLLGYLTPHQGRALDVSENREAPRKEAPVIDAVSRPAWRDTPAASSAAVICGLLLLGFEAVSYSASIFSNARSAASPQILNLGGDVLPLELVGWRRTGFITQSERDDWGDETQRLQWQYAMPHALATIVAEYPYRGLDRVNEQLLSQGWNLLQSNAAGLIQVNSSLMSPRFTADYSRSVDDSFGRLLLMVLDESGQAVTELSNPMNSGSHVIQRLQGRSRWAGEPRGLLLQVFVESSVPRDDNSESDLQDLFTAAAQQMAISRRADSH